MEGLYRLLRDEVESGRSPAVQAYVSHKRVVHMDIALGEADSGVSATPETLFPWYCATKPLTATAVAQLWERNRLDLDAPVATYLPAFAQNGKDGVTVRHILTHTAGFADEPTGWVPGASWEETAALALASNLEPGWVAGVMAKYSGWTGWCVLGELIRTIDGRMPHDYIRDEVLRPAGVEETHLFITEELISRLGRSRFGRLFQTIGGQRAAMSSIENELYVSSPASGAIGPMRDLGRFLEAVVECMRPCAEAIHPRILSTGTANAVVAPQQLGMIFGSFQPTAYWGLGFPVGELYSPGCSPRSFGARGERSCLGHADPDAGVVLAILFSGMPARRNHRARVHATLAAAYDDLGIPLLPTVSDASTAWVRNRNRTNEIVESSPVRALLGTSVADKTDEEIEFLANRSGGLLGAVVAGLRPTSTVPVPFDVHIRYRVVLPGDRRVDFALTASEGGPLMLQPDQGEDPELTYEASAADFVRIGGGVLDHATATAEGRLRIIGDLSVVVKLSHLLSAETRA